MYEKYIKSKKSFGITTTISEMTQLVLIEM